jgi:tetratricopeptide (TPR) repeat protein
MSRTIVISRGVLGIICILLLSLAIARPLKAQEARWKELNAQVEQLYQQGKYAEAIPLAQESVHVAEATFGPEHPNVATSFNNLAALYLRQGRYAEAEPLFKRALAIREKALGPGHPDVATSLNNLAGLYDDQGRYADAEPLFKRALAIREKAVGSDHLDVAESLNNLAALYDDQGRYADAEPLYKRALAIREKALGPDHPDVAQSLNNLAELHRAQGRYADAEPLYRRALAIREKALGPDHPDVATLLNNLAALYDDQGRYADAEPLYKRALAINEKALGPDHPAVAQSLNNLAELYYEQSRYAEAEPLFKRALAIREKALGPDHPAVATLLNNLAVLYDDQGRYADAEPLYKRALAIKEKALGPDHPAVATSLNNLALLYKQQGRYADAEPLYKRALAIREKALGPDHPDVAQSLNNLALLYDDQGRYADAEPLYKRALAIREKALGPDHPDVAQSLNNLALLYDDQGRYADAEPLYKRTLAIDVKALGLEHPDVATDLNNLAVLYKEQGRYADAEPLYKRALAILEKALGPDHPLVTTSLTNLAGLFHAWAQPAQAAPFFDRALESLAKQFQYYFTYMSEKERLAFLATVQDQFPAYFSFCFTYRQQFPELAGKMYDTVLWQKGFIAQSVAALRAKIIASGDAEALRLLDELAAKKSELAQLATAPAEAEPQKQAARLAQIEQLEKEANDLEKELVKRSGALAEEKRLAHVTWQQVRDALKKDEAAVEIVRFPFYDGKKWTGASEYVALIVRPDSQQPQFVALGEAKALEDDPLRDYRLRAGLSESRTIRGVEMVAEESEKNAAAPTTSFYQAFWKPLEPVLGSARRVYVSTDGVLNQVALGVVPDNAGQLLMEKYDLRIVSSTKVVLRQRRASTGNTAVVMGNPLFGLDEVQQRLAVRALQKTEQTEKTEKAAAGEPVAMPSTGRRSRDLRGGALNPLPGTQKEAEAVSNLLKEQHWGVELYTQQNALEERVKRVQSPRVLHLATHGFFESDQERKQKDPKGLGKEHTSGLEDPMLRSGLYLTGANRTLEGRTTPPDMDDGVLTAYEATQLDLQGTELVVLSACETGLGESQNGEGVFGLRRALQEAGAESVLMSMWSVPDQETQELMTLFYRKWLGGKDKHEALREAQRELRASVTARYGRDLAYYWGAFVLVGR